MWTFGAAHPLTSSTFDGVVTTGGTSSSFGTDTGLRRVNNVIASAQKFHPGFAYGPGVAGSSAASSYLWSSTNGAGGALPYTQVYLRPQVSSRDAGFALLPDTGSSAVGGTTVATSLADDLPWHVSGLAGSTSTEGNVEVQAFTQSGSTMYVGGNFATVQREPPPPAPTRSPSPSWPGSTSSPASW